MSIEVRIARQGADEGITLRENSLVGMPIPVRVRHPGCTLEVKKGDRTIRVIHILSPGEISEDLKKQRDQIEADVDASIDRFLLITNRNFAKRIWQMIRYFRQPEEGFRVLQEYMHNPDDARLRDEIRSHQEPNETSGSAGGGVRV